MHRHAQHRLPKAFTLIELLVVVLVIALLMALLLPALAGARQAGRRAVCMSNMKQLGVAHAMYADGFKDFIASFNGRAEDRAARAGTFPYLPDLETQALNVLKKYSGRTNWPAFNNFNIQDDTTVVCEQYSSLVLVDYMGGKLPMPVAACPEDRPRRSWQAHPLGMASSPYKPTKTRNIDSHNIQWWPYSSSYQLMPTAWANDGPANTINAPTGYQRRDVVLGQAGTHDKYAPHHKPAWGGRRRDEISYPSMKVAVADSQQRHSGRTDLYYAYPQARQPLLFWDASVSIRRTGDANMGWDPKDSNPSGGPTKFLYDPDLAFESPALPGSTDNPQGGAVVIGYYKWTRGGLKGVDYGAQEISTLGW